ncbi:MAG TPA: hypothetical protein VIS72_15540 [Anaerolineales bacterium]
MAVKKKASSKKVEAKSKKPARGKAKSMKKTKPKAKAASKAGARTKVQKSEPVRIVNKISAPRIQSGEERKSARGARAIHQYNYMKAPGIMHDFSVGDKVEVFCDHDKGGDRTRGWIAGIVVQVDSKLVAVQFRSNVYLTDGWMVPDRILWYSLTSEHIRPAAGTKKAAALRKTERAITDY